MIARKIFKEDVSLSQYFFTHVFTSSAPDVNTGLVRILRKSINRRREGEGWDEYHETAP